MMRRGITRFMRNPHHTQMSPPDIIAGTNSPPADIPTLAKKKDRYLFPVAWDWLRSKCKWRGVFYDRNGPREFTTTSGPPANPNFMGTLIPGMARGMLPNMIPRNIPTNSVTMLGSWRRFVELPSFSAKRLMSSIRPTTVRRSPICNSD